MQHIRESIIYIIFFSFSFNFIWSLHLYKSGDANICAKKWEDPKIKLTETAEELKSSLAQCGLTNIDLGNTYLADRLDNQGNTIQSALDHIYVNDSLLNRAKCVKLETSSTDHVPIIARINMLLYSRSEKQITPKT